jgi:hypothetical protein
MEKSVDYFLVSTNGENLPLIPSCRPWVIAMQYTLKTPDDGLLVQAETETEHLLAIQPCLGCLTHPAHGQHRAIVTIFCFGINHDCHHQSSFECSLYA